LEKKQAAAAQAAATFEDIEFGGERFNLHAVLTTRGAAVRQLTLNNFKGADSYGLPTGEKFDLLPRVGDQDVASHVLYHFRDPDDERPVLTLGQIAWAVEKKEVAPDAESHLVVLTADVRDLGVRIRKTYTLGKDDYHLGLTLRFERLPGGDARPFRYQLTSGHGLPIEGVWYTTTFRNSLIATVDARDDPHRDFQDSRTVSAVGAGQEILSTPERRLQYAGVVNQFFASVVVVDDRQEKRDFLARARPTLVSEDQIRHPNQGWLDDIVVRAVSAPLALPAGGEPVEHKYLLYNGPVKVRLLHHLQGERSVPTELVDRYEQTLHLRTLTDYHFPGFFGEVASKLQWTRLLIWTTNLMHGVLFQLHRVVPFYGVCIILLTLMVRAAMFPISRKQAMTTVRMQELAPELKKLQEKHKDDKQGMAMAQMELYRKHGVHPLGSCWILLLQMPIFLGLYYALQESIHFRLAPFLWIRNLAAPDMLLWWGERVPWLTDPASQGSMFYLGPYLNILPIVAVVLMLLQQKLMMPPPADEQQEMQQKVMKYMLVFMAVLFYKVAAGLTVYFIVSSLWGMTERKLLPKAKPTTGAPVATPPPPKPGRPTGGKAKGPAPKANGDGGFFDKVRQAWDEVLKEARKK
jgi:YidC/Oxa1 family membrane protein insertase